MQRNGIRTSITAISYVCALGFRSKVLARLFELRHEISRFVLSQKNDHLYVHLEHDRWIAKLAYMTDISEHLNNLKQMQGKMKIQS